MLVTARCSITVSVSIADSSEMNRWGKHLALSSPILHVERMGGGGGGVKA